MDPISAADVNAIAKAQPAPAKKPTERGSETPTGGYAADSLDAAKLQEAVDQAKAKPALLSDAQLQNIAQKKATCPFIGSAVAGKALAVRNSGDKPLASIDDVVALGNTGGGDLGEVLKVFATGNHAFMAGPTGKLDAPVPGSLFSLDFPGSQGSHPGHSGILQGDPTQLDSGRFSQADFDRLISRAKDGCVKRSDIAKFMAENLLRDPHAKVFGARPAGLLLGDVGRSVLDAGPALFEKVKHLFGSKDSEHERKFTEALTKTLGEDNLIGSSGEFGLLMAFLANSPRTKTIDGEPALSVADLKAMFQEHRLPDGWEHWPKTRKDWLTNTTALMLEAGKDYHQLKGQTGKS